MIAFIKGLIAAVSEDNVVIDTGAIGYNVKISTGTASLLPGIGQEICLHTFTHVREDAFQLYGFQSRDDVEIFKQLISVSGIGPKGGLALLSIMNSDELRFAIMAGDARAIARAPGIGIKTAERVILDLRGKVELPDAPEYADVPLRGGAGAVGELSAASEAVEALVALGYGATEAMKAVKKAGSSTDMAAGAVKTEDVLKAALKHLY